MRPLLAAALVALTPAAASAGPSLALRVGYAFASGSASKGEPMSDVAKGAVPLEVEALWRWEHFAMGAYYGFGLGFVSTTNGERCDSLGVSCSVWTMRTGVEGTWTFSDVSQRWAPWIGLGVGYEWAHEKVSGGAGSSTQNVSGWEALDLQGGADVKISPKAWLGPYLSLRYGEYTRLDGFGIVNKAFHQWLELGVRGTWDF